MASAIPSDLLAAIENAPSEERALLELRLRWSGLDDARARIVAKVGRNEPCPCGSGRKHKRCCA